LNARFSGENDHIFIENDHKKKKRSRKEKTRRKEPYIADTESIQLSENERLQMKKRR